MRPAELSDIDDEPRVSTSRHGHSSDAGCVGESVVARHIVGPTLTSATGQKRVPEALMWRPSASVQVKASVFDVRRAVDASDLNAAGRVLADGHGFPPDIVERVF